MVKTLVKTMVNTMIKTTVEVFILPRVNYYTFFNWLELVSYFEILNFELVSWYPILFEIVTSSKHDFKQFDTRYVVQ